MYKKIIRKNKNSKKIKGKKFRKIKIYKKIIRKKKY